MMMEVPRVARERFGLDLHLNRLPAGMGTDLVEMGTWRIEGGGIGAPGAAQR
jgi:hypothetical protein